MAFFLNERRKKMMKVEEEEGGRLKKKSVERLMFVIEKTGLPSRLDINYTPVGL